MDVKKRLLKSFDFKIGFIATSFLFLWGILWFVYSRFIVGTWSSPYYPITDIKEELIAPSWHYFFGTDVYGRALFEVISEGLLYSIGTALTVSLGALLVGIVVGQLSFRSKFIIANILDLLTGLIFIFPSFLIAILVMSYLKDSKYALIVTLIFTGWPAYAKVIKNETIRIDALPYIEGARAVGLREWRIFLYYILPGILPSLAIQMVLSMSGVIIAEASLGFLGLASNKYSWGNLLSMGKDVLLEAPYLAIIVSFVLTILIVGLNLLSDGLRDALDPKLKK